MSNHNGNEFLTGNLPGEPATDVEWLDALERGVVGDRGGQFATTEKHGENSRIPTDEDLARWTPHGDGREPQRERQREPIPDPLPFSTLAERFPTMRPPVIEGLLRKGESACLNAKAKDRKSWFLYMVLLNIASGGYLLGRFKCTSGKVLLLDNELHPESLAKRIPEVADALGVAKLTYSNNLDVLTMRGHLRTIHELAELFGRVKDRYSLVAVDALYRILPPNVSENDNAAMAAVFNAIDAYADTSGAAFWCNHHQTKGSQADKDVVDVGSGASSFARAVDAHLVLRQHEETDCVVLDAALRSWAPIDPMGLQWCYPVWRPADHLDPEKLKGRRPPAEERRSQQHSEDDGTVFEALKASSEPLSERRLRRATGLSKYRVEGAVSRLCAREKLTAAEDVIRGNKTMVYAVRG